VPRPERALDPEADPLQRFASELRQLRRRAGGPTYRELARRANYSASVLAEAAGGARLPTLAATLAYVGACGGERSEWERRWRAAAAAAAGRSGGPGPAELPATLDTFTGRETALAQLQHMLETPGNGSPRVAVIHGIAGVGKTTLAIHSGHRVADRFPDGQLFVNLHGYTDGLAPRDPLDVLGAFLRGLGLTARDIPSTVEEAAARYRSMLARRRILVVLDNARGSAQVRPLVPANPGCAVLVTSRVPLLDLDGARHLPLDVLEPAESVALLGRLAGTSGAEPDAARRLARACGHLPLALRIAGARLAARPTLTMDRLADRLARPQRRLDELRLGDLAVRTSLDLSYRSLADGDRRAYRMLSLLDGPDFGLRVASAQLDQPEPAVEEVLDRLVGEHLIDEPVEGRYRFHDLLRLFGRERAGQLDTDAEREAALCRVLRCYTSAGGDSAALDWLDAELPGVLAAAHRAATSPAPTAALVPQLAIALYPYLLVRPHWRDWESLDRLALGVTRRLGDKVAQARLLDHLGVVCRKQFRIDEALAAIRDSLGLYQALGDHASEARAWSSLGNVHFDRHRYGDAIACLRRSLDLRRVLDDRAGEAAALANLANVLKRTGHIEEALDACIRSLAIWRELGDRHREARVLCSLGEALVEAGRIDEALHWYREASRIACDFGDRHGEAYTLVAIGEAHRRAGRLDAALAACERGLALDREIGDRWGEGDALHRLGLALRDCGDRRQARARWQDALRCFEEIDAPDSANVLAELRALECV